MSRFIESIKLKDGQLHLLDYHAQRIERTLKTFYPKKRIKLLKHLETLPSLYPVGWFKVRVVYQASIESVQVIPYYPKPIHRLRLVQSEVDYAYKYENRAALKSVLRHSQQGEDVIIIKNDLVTDSSYANLAFFDETHWLTPEKPLLSGVQRQYLLNNSTIKTANISKKSLKTFQKIKLFNALLNWEDAIVLNMDECLINNIDND